MLNQLLPEPLEPRIDYLITNNHHNSKPHRPSPRSSLHTRSYSDYTHPYPTVTTIASATSIPTTNSAHVQHRRAFSATTFDTSPLHHEQPSVYPSTSSSSSSSDEPSSPIDHPEPHKDSKTQRSPSPTTNTKPHRYICTYCTKGFSRPSSLRIHTYSHTGERPFECPEEGCDRKFSVQSNMRRHLRVHRLGRPLKRNGGLISPADRAQLINKPLAAKPVETTWLSANPAPASVSYSA
ncbi:MAG: hypothetical protein EXX96DRAFT_569343 [Benjaminiella poitrasii]|nr:MAG: hypothetical protein EXX96DRAFT_569343 [Benjaminiella poitrasii]